MTLVETIEFDGAVKFYPYRTAKVHDRFVTVPRDDLDYLEVKLAEAANVRGDNHVVYAFTSTAGESLFAWFTDEKAYIGRTLVERRW